MSLKAQKSKKLKEMELQKISFMVDCLKEKVKNEEEVTTEDKQEFLDDVGASIDTIISFNTHSHSFERAVQDGTLPPE